MSERNNKLFIIGRYLKLTKGFTDAANLKLEAKILRSDYYS